MLRKTIMSLAFITVYIISGIIFYGEHNYMLITTMIAAFIISIIVNKKSQNKSLDFTILNAILFIILFFTCLIGKNFSRGLPYLVFIPLASLLGFRISKTHKKLIPLLSILSLVIIAFFFQTNYFSFYHNKNAEKNIAFPNIDLIDKNGKTFTINKNKIVVLDFWSTNCSICFKKFPELEQIYLKYKSNPQIEIYALNVPIKNDNFNRTKKILDSIGYKFPKLYAKSANEVNEKLKIYSFPHLLIIKNGIIRFDGMFETNQNILAYNTKDEIEKLLDKKK